MLLYSINIIMLIIHALHLQIAGNTKLVTLSDAVKLAVDGNLQIPGSIILTLKKYYKVMKRRERGERGREEKERERERER